MDKSGKTIASSNRDAPDSFVGQSYAFRPYFKQAIKGNTGRYFAVGVTSKAPGYYVSRPVRAARGKAIMGVAVIKVSLQNVTQELQAAGQKGNSLICLADPRGVVFLASQPDMILKSLWPVAEKDLAELQEQYGKDKFPAIFPEKIGDGSKVDYQGAQLSGVLCRNHPRRLVGLLFSPRRDGGGVPPDRHCGGRYLGAPGLGNPGQQLLLQGTCLCVGWAVQSHVRRRARSHWGHRS